MIFKDGNEKELQSYMNNKYTIAIVWAEFCGPCTMMKALLEEFAKAREDVNLVMLNVDYNQDFVIENKITGTPTVFIYKDGIQIDKFVGFLPKEMIEGKLK